MKKRLGIILLMFVTLLVGCSEETTEVNYEELSRKEQLVYEVEKIVKEFNSTSIKDVTVNDHLGTDDPNDYLLLIYLSFDAKNRAGTAKDMIEMYNNELGSKLATQIDITEVAIFWEVPYLKEGDNIAKANLQREGDNMFFEEVWFNGTIFN